LIVLSRDRDQDKVRVLAERGGGEDHQMLRVGHPNERWERRQADKKENEEGMRDIILRRGYHHQIDPSR
jgi:hypothetical protein